MPKIPHTYRRGAIYWFRKVLRLFDGRRLDIRLSMDTARPAEARAASQVLAVATTGVTKMLNQKLSRERWLTDDDLRSMANAAYQQTLAQLRTAERKNPIDVESVLRPVWTGFHDLLGVLETDPMRPVSVDEVEPALRAMGFDDGRLQSLREIAALTGGGATAITSEMVDGILEQHGHALTERNRTAARLAMIPMVKQAFLTVAIPPSGQGMLAGAVDATPPALTPAPVASAGGPAMTEVMELCIPFRAAADNLSEDSCRQIRKAVELFVFANGDLPVSQLKQVHAGQFVNLMTQLPKSYGRNKDDIAGGLSASVARGKKLKPADRGLSGVTRNKHITWVQAVLQYARSSLGVAPAEPLDFSELRSKKPAGEDKPRMSWSDPEIKLLLSAPVWSGCAGLFDRLTRGEHVWHDAWYFGPTGLALHGCRSDEFMGLALDEIFEDAPTPYFIIRDNAFRRVKTGSSIRTLPISPEFIRLGFLDYVREMRSLKHKLVFPEMYAPGNKSGFDSTFYKTIFSKLRLHAFPEGTEHFRQSGGAKEKDAHSLRGSMANLLLGKVPDSIREDVLGHRGKGTTRKNYDEPAALALKLEAISKLSFLTEHIDAKPLNLRPPEWQKHGQPRGRPANGGRGVLPKRPKRLGRRMNS